MCAGLASSMLSTRACVTAVSYTHLDVYKRQVRDSVTHAPRVFAGRVLTSRKTEGLRTELNCMSCVESWDMYHVG